jgi:hypothetical protein
VASGRSGGGAPLKVRAAVLAASDLCWICEHPGALTVDHLTQAPYWPRLADGRMAPGFNHPMNLAPAHGTMGAGRTIVHNRCTTCGRLCNQSRGARRPPPPRPQSRDWGTPPPRPQSRQW